jgi:hypothetical protein
VDQTRRLAIIDGRILRVGDPVGRRVIVRIEPDGVVLREPSGLEVSLQLRGAVVEFGQMTESKGLTSGRQKSALRLSFKGPRMTLWPSPCAGEVSTRA